MSPRWMCQRRVTWAGVRPTLRGDLGDRLVVEDTALGDRRPGLGEDPGVVARGADGLVGEVGVHLDLVHRRGHVRLRGEPREVGDLEVGDADRTGPAVGLELLERLPGGDEVAVVPRRQRPVDEEQVDLVEARARTGCGRRPCGRRRARGSRCSACWSRTDVVAGDAGRGDRLADALLVAVHLGGVDVPVAGLERLAGDLRGVLRWDLEDAEAELRDRCCRRSG